MKNLDGVTFGGSALDRAAHLRRDPLALAALALRPNARRIALRAGEPLVEGDGDRPIRLARADAVLGDGAGQEAPAIFLGLEDGEGIWAYDVPSSLPGCLPDGTEDGAGLRWAELRSVMVDLSPRDAELAAMAKALFGWHASHRFCAACGAPTVVAQAGWQRDCPACGAHHFPRTDPVVIMLVTRGNAVLLGRSPAWPEGMHSLLAGFVEPGETVEAAVRREVLEEAGIRVGPVRYLSSQPWPFPASLMLGCAGEALDDEIVVDPLELESALWVPRERMARVFAGRDPAIRAPRAGAVAASILRGWLADRLG